MNGLTDKMSIELHAFAYRQWPLNKGADAPPPALVLLKDHPEQKLKRHKKAPHTPTTIFSL